MTNLNTLAKAIALVAFFVINPIIVGPVYITMFIIRSAAKCVSDPVARFIGISIACIFIAFIAPLFFAAFPGILFCGIFAAILIWIFGWTNKTPAPPKQDTTQYYQQPPQQYIDVEVISEKTHYRS